MAESSTPLSAVGPICGKNPTSGSVPGGNTRARGKGSRHDMLRTVPPGAEDDLSDYDASLGARFNDFADLFIAPARQGKVRSNIGAIVEKQSPLGVPALVQIRAGAAIRRQLRVRR